LNTIEHQYIHLYKIQIEQCQSCDISIRLKTYEKKAKYFSPINQTINHSSVHCMQIVLTSIYVRYSYHINQ